MRRTILAPLLVALLALPLAAGAVGVADVGAPLPGAAEASIGGAELLLNLKPEHPRANASVTIEAENWSANLDSADFVWKVNDRTIRQGRGVKSVTVRVGALGSITTVSVTAVVPDGRAFAGEVRIQPADVELLWQAQGYTPPFYKGKALMPFEGTTLIAAVPRFADSNGRPIPARELLYTWKEDGTVIGDSSGYGQSLFLVKSAIPFRAKTVSVDAATADGEITASASTVIEPVEPRLVFYENSPRYGVRFESALNGTFSLQDEEAALTTVPYYIETPKRSDRAISYRWSLNGAPLAQQGADVVLRRVTSQGGSSRLAVEVENPANPFQGARGTLTVLFPSLVESFTEL